ncbi:unannotated protein [freshwater metagenome]|uniref:Unannotated protein n=1 Tax=freshwater metagenome TaxID=449393 RepID=A0A6J6BE43_9ZZZZ|nr:hypothetical protein [Actinomycetota bacterium]
MTKTRGPLPDPDDSTNGSDAKADGTSENPEIKQVELTSDEPVSFEVPPNTNLVVNVVGKQGGGCVSSFFSGCGCLATGFIAIALILAAIGSQSR